MKWELGLLMAACGCALSHPARDCRREWVPEGLVETRASQTPLRRGTLLLAFDDPSCLAFAEPAFESVEELLEADGMSGEVEIRARVLGEEGLLPALEEWVDRESEAYRPTWVLWISCEGEPADLGVDWVDASHIDPNGDPRDELAAVTSSGQLDGVPFCLSRTEIDQVRRRCMITESAPRLSEDWPPRMLNCNRPGRRPTACPGLCEMLPDTGWSATECLDGFTISLNPDYEHDEIGGMHVRLLCPPDL